MQEWSNIAANTLIYDIGRSSQENSFSIYVEQYGLFVKKLPFTDLANELYDHPDFSEGISTLCLAMSTLVKNRKNKQFVYHEELYKDI